MTLTERDRAVVWHPFTQAATAQPPLPVVAASGSWLELADGSRVFDAISSWWTCLIGHSHPELVAAIAEQARVWTTCFLPVARIPARWSWRKYSSPGRRPV